MPILAGENAASRSARSHIVDIRRATRPLSLPMWVHESVRVDGPYAYLREELQHFKSPVELALMRKIKAALDPAGIMNPGQVL